MKTPTFKNFMDSVANAKGDQKKIKEILEPIYLDHLRLQHLDDVKNDILPFQDGEETTCPKVNAEWLLRTPNASSDLRTMIDDDMQYWAAQ